MWREQAMIEWSQSVNSIVACGHGAKLCAHGRSGFSDRNKIVLWHGCRGRAVWSPHKKNVRSVRFVVKRRGCCCNLSGGVTSNVWFTTNGMCVKNNNIFMWRKQAITEWPQPVNSIVACCHGAKLCAHATRAYPIATKWCCDQDMELVPSSAFTQKNVRSVRFVVIRRGCWCNLSGGAALIVWFTTNGMCAKNNNIYTWRVQAIIEWSWHANSVVACCQSAKLWAYATRVYPFATALYYCTLLLTSSSNPVTRPTVCI